MDVFPKVTEHGADGPNIMGNFLLLDKDYNGAEKCRNGEDEMAKWPFRALEMNHD